MPVTLPHTFVAGELASAKAVDDNFNAVVAAIEGVGAAATASDVYQPGTLASTDWALVGAGPALNTVTGALKYASVGGAAWLPGEVSGLVRTFTANAEHVVTPPSLPAANGYKNIGVELTVSGVEATVSAVAGTEQASEALAIANPPAVTAGKTRILNFVVKNTAGVMSVPFSEDRRPWALGKALAGPFASRTLAFRAQYGETAETSGTFTATMPTPVGHSGESVELWNTSGVLTIATVAGVFVGDFVGSAATLTLLADQHVKLRSEGANWVIVAGEPKRTAKYTALAALAEATPLEPSATRPSTVNFEVKITKEVQGATFLVGGVNMGTAAVGAGPGAAGFVLPFRADLNAGEAVQWKREGSFAPGEGVKYSYKLL